MSGRCKAENDNCQIPGSGEAGGACVAGRCQKCGDRGQQCCGYVDDLTCLPGLRCTDKVCTNCGGVGEACCEGRDGADRCRPGSICSSPSGAGVCGACGDPGQKCCAGEGCRNGCCYHGKCVAEGADCIYGSGAYGRCAGGRCQCGYPGETCCSYGWSKFGGGECVQDGTQCNFGDTVETSRCETCGNLGESCCAPPKQCSIPGLTCTYDKAVGKETCQPCGALDQVCCESYPACTDPKTTCYGTTSSSVRTCRTCGSPGGYCCNNGQCDSPDTACDRGNCTRCGVPGTPCCPGHQCTSGCCLSTIGDNGSVNCLAPGTSCDDSATNVEGPFCTANNTCEKPAATPCGGLGQACCLSNMYGAGSAYCAAPGTSCRWQQGKGNTCVPCGDKGQICCVSRADDGAACKAPYRCVSNKTDGTEVFLCTEPGSTATGTATTTSTK